LRTFFGTKWLASGPSRNLRGFSCEVVHFWPDCIALSLETGSGMGPPISRSVIEAAGTGLWIVDNFPRGASFYFAAPTSIEAHE